jgi:Kef-type K+ transport system membrane component KefB
MGAAPSVGHVSLLLALVLVAAKLGGEVATRLRQPPVLGELLAGVLLGSLRWSEFRDLSADPTVDMLSQLGVLILLFEVGLESTVRDVVSVGAAAIRVAVLGTVGSFACGFAAARLVAPHESLVLHAFLGASITATSVGITARVFKDLGQARSPEARTILGASVLDDVIGLVILALVSAWITSHQSGVTSLLWILAKTLGFLGVTILVGRRVTPRLFGFTARLRTGGALLAAGLAFCFLLAWAASAMGLAPLIGAFAAGLVVEDLHSARFVARGERSLSELLEPISGFLVPIFFVVMGLRADVRLVLHAETLLLAAVLTVAAVLGKLACALGARRGMNRLALAFGMMPRGEVSLIYASLGVTLLSGGEHLLDRKGYSALVAVVLLTTIMTPIALKWSFGRRVGAAVSEAESEA